MTRIAHTARFLQTMHTGLTTAQRAAASQTAPPTDTMSAEAFVKGAVTANRPAPAAKVKVESDGLSVEILTGSQYASEAQVRWMLSIAAKRELPSGATVQSLLVRLEQGFARKAASDFITKYKNLPFKQVRVTAAMAEAIAPGASIAEINLAQGIATEIPAEGRYAIVEDGVTKFYRIDRPIEGKWAGRDFLKIQASDDYHRITDRHRKSQVYKAILEDPMALRRYGMELGKCGKCDRTLTNETSRAYGIGPECRKK